MTHSLRKFVMVVFVLIGALSASFGNQAMSSTRSPVAPVADKIIHISALVAASPTKAFSYFTSDTLIESWLTAAADVEPRVGGKYELFWQPEDRDNNSTIGCRITALAAGQVLAFQWRSPKQFKSFANSADPLTHVVVSFMPEGSGTRVQLIHSGWRSGTEWEKARLWQETAWTLAFKELERVAKQ